MRKLSIIVYAYNIDHYIDKCLWSILYQMDNDVELIVIDDCSTDKTVVVAFKLLSEYANKNFRLIKLKQNMGIGHARNVGIQESTGKYIAFINGDDTVTKNYLPLILPEIDKDLDYYKLSWSTMMVPPKVYRSNMLPERCTSVWCRVFKRSIIEHMFNEDNNLASEDLFLKENIKPGHTCGYIHKVVYKYRDYKV
jgi:glycosyltransferase involved in cell wall biosynthesis